MLGFAFALLLCGCAPGSDPASRDTVTLPGQRLVDIDIHGMHDAAGVARVKHHLSHIPGVRHVEVNLARGRARIRCEVTVTDSALTAAVRRAGSKDARVINY